MATIKLRESGWWQAKVRRKGFPDQNKTFKTKGEAEVWARRVEAEMDRGVFVSTDRASATTFEDFAKEFETGFAPHHYRGAAWKHKLKALRARLGKYSLLVISPQIVAKYRDERLSDPDPRFKKTDDSVPRVSGATVKSELDLLSKLFDVAMKEYEIPLPAGNPVHGVRKPKTGQGRERRLSSDEWARLENECRSSGNPWLSGAVTLSVETAMRQGELLSLQRSTIDRQRKLALLIDTSKLKTGEPRAVPLSSRALVALDALPASIDGRVIPLDRMTLYKAFGRACKRASIHDFTWHDLRHEALSRLAERGDFTVLDLAAVSGHKTLQMLKRYTHLQAERLAQKLG